MRVPWRTRPPSAGGPIRAPATLRGVIRVPSDKSISHRALIANALAEGESTVSVRAPGGDVLTTVGALVRFGVPIDAHGMVDNEIHFPVSGGGTGDAIATFRRREVELSCRNSGTTMRLFTGVSATQPARVTLRGDPSLELRPMERVASPLRRMGAAVTTENGLPPLVVEGRRPLRALHHDLPVASAQVLGAICFAALAADGETTVTTPGPTRDHTERLLGWMGAEIARDGRVTTIRGPSGLRARSLVVPGDPSSAAAWLVAAALHPDADVRVLGVSLNPTRLALVDVLREMGATIEIEPRDGGGPEPVGDLRVRTAGQLQAIELRGGRVAALIDELPLVAIAMAGADGVSELRDAAELRVKESDRIASVVCNLSAVGAEVHELPDGWRVRRGRPRDANVTTDGDHRIAMAFAIAALAGVATSVVIDDPGCVEISYRTFWRDLETLSGREHPSLPGGLGS